MNPVSRLVLKWYLFLTFLGVGAAISTKPLSLLSGIIFIWVCFLIFFLAVNDKLTFNNNRYKVSSRSRFLDGFRIPYFPILSFFTIAASYYAAVFYTGKSVSDVVLSFTLGGSLYNDYQKYFAEQGLGVFTLSKLPAIFSMFFIKAVIVYGYIGVIVLTRKVIISQVFWLFLASISSVYFSLARGTSFEMFEILLLLWFCISMRSIRYGTGKGPINIPKLTLISVAIIALSIYSYNISARYSFGDTASCITPDMCLNKESFLFYFSPALGSLSLKLSGYFTFGIYYISVLINDYWLSDIFRFFKLLLPFSGAYGQEIEPRFLCYDFIKCGASWNPDASVYIISFGFIATFFMVYGLGFLIKKITVITLSRSDPVRYILLYYAFLAMVSLPVGNFITISSANKLMLFTACTIVFLRYVSRIFK